ncbi:MAG: hypothetical protein V4613_12330 [Bacteroidota bacterium]
MSLNKSIITQLRQLNHALSQTLEDAEQNKHPEFFRESIKHSAIQIFEAAQLLSANAQETTPVEIKIIKQEEVEEVKPVAPPITKVEIKPDPPVQTPPPPVVVTEPIKPVIEETKVVVEAPKVVVEVKQSAPAPISTPSVNDKLDEDDDDETVNDKIAKNKKPVINVAEKLKELPIKDLAKSISISKKFEFINDLFDGNSEAYKTCIQTIETSAGYEQATGYLENDVMAKFTWDDNELLAAEFFALVKRRFM